MAPDIESSMGRPIGYSTLVEVEVSEVDANSVLLLSSGRFFVIVWVSTSADINSSKSSSGVKLDYLK
jgi:hypothetical protein